MMKPEYNEPEDPSKPTATLSLVVTTDDGDVFECEVRLQPSVSAHWAWTGGGKIVATIKAIEAPKAF